MFTTIQEGIAAIQKQILSDMPPEQALYIPAQGTHTISRDEKPFDLYQALTEFVVFDNKIVDQKAVVVKTETRRKVLLLLGETGSGKSVFCQDLITRLWQNYKFGMPIPLFIPLARLQDPVNNAITETLTEYGFSAEQIATLKKEQQFIFILDGYDEIHQLKNLYVTNRLGEWQAKTIITCRSQYLYHVNESDKYFMPFAAEKRQPHLLQQLHVAPFAEKEIVAYVQQYEKTALSPNSKTMAIAVAADTKDHKSDDKTAVAINVSVTDQPLLYQQLISVPGLSSLITTPFLLHLAVEALPEILEKTKDQKSNDQPNFTQAALYDVFIARWFKRQEIKLRTSKHIDEKIVDPKPNFWNFCKALAVAMRTEQVSLVNYTPEKTSRLFATAATAALKVDPWKDFFSNDAETELLRSACPLRKFGKNQYGFIHGSMIEYFATRMMYDELIAQPQAKPIIFATNNLSTADNKDTKSNTPIIQNSNQQTNSTPLPKNALYQTLISKDANMIQFLADRVVQDEKFKQKLFEIIELSKTSERHAIGAANSITALARAKIAFSGMDLCGIRINDADVSYGIFDSTNLTGADLKNVDMQGTWLREAKLNNADMTGVEFGELPFLQLPDSVYACHYSNDGRWLAVVSGKNIHLYDANTRKLEYIFKGHTKTILSISFSPSAQLLISGSEDKTICVWDVAGQKKVGILEGHSVAVKSVVFCLNGAQVVSSGDEDGSIRVWDVSNKQLVHIFKDHKKEVLSLASNPNGLMLASAGDDQVVRLWDMTNRTLLHIFEGHLSSVKCLAFSSNGLMLASASHGRIHLWNIPNRNLMHIFKINTAIYCVAFSPNSSWLASGNMNNDVQLWDIANRKLEHTFEGHTRYLRAVSFHPGGQYITSGGLDDTLRLWSIPKQKHQPIFEGHTEDIRNIAFSPNNQWIASASFDSTACLWNVESGSLKYTFKIYTFGTLRSSGNVYAVAFSPDNFKLFIGGNDSEIWKCDLTNLRNIVGRKTEHLLKNAGEVLSINISPDGRKLASGCYRDKTVCLWDIASSSLEHTFKGHTAQINCVTFSSTGRWLASASDDKSIRLWDALNHKFERIFEGHTGEVWYVDFSPNGCKLASAGHDNTIRLWDLVSGKLEHTFKGHTDSVNSVAFSPDGLKLASSSRDCTVRLWDVANLHIVPVFKEHTKKINCVAFSRDGCWSASGSDDNTVRLWNMMNQKLQYTLAGHTDQINSVAFSHDGRWLASGSKDTTIRLWDRASGKLQFTFKGTDKIEAIAFSPDGQYLASGDYYVKLWSIADGKVQHIFRELTFDGKSIAFSPNGRWIATGGNDNTVALWAVVEKKLEHLFKGHVDSVRCVAFSPDGRWLLSSNLEATCLWDLPSRKLEHTFATEMTADSLAFSPDSLNFVSGYLESIRLWSTTSKKLEHTFEGHTGLVKGVAFNATNFKLVSGGDDCTVRLWDAKKYGQTLMTIKGCAAGVNSVKWRTTSQGLFLATAGADKTIRYWQVMDGKNDETKAKLLWSSRQTVLVAPDAYIENVKGLSEVNRDLLEQRGAIQKSLSKPSVDSKKDYKEPAVVNTKQNVAPLATAPQTFFAPQSQQLMRTSMSARPPVIQQYVQPVAQNIMQQQPQFFAPPIAPQRQMPTLAANPNQSYAPAAVVNQQAVYQPQFFAPQQQAQQQQYYHAPVVQQPVAPLSVQNNAASSPDCCCVIS